jgi:hypothetical protein
VDLIKDSLDIAFVTANKLVEQLERLGILEEINWEKARTESSPTRPTSSSSATNLRAWSRVRFRRRKPMSVDRLVGNARSRAPAIVGIGCERPAQLSERLSHGLSQGSTP